MSGIAGQEGLSGPDQIYKASAGLKYTLGFVFFLAVLFAINAIVGSVWLVRHNLWLDALIFFLLFGAGCWLVFLGAAFLFSATNTEAVLGANGLALLVPNWRGPTPYVPYRRLFIPYSDISAIETRGEIYKYYVLPIAAKCLTVVRRNGERVQIGYTRENAAENAFPYAELAEELSRRTGLPVASRGTVAGGTRLRALLHDEPPQDAPSISDAEAARLLNAEAKAWKGAMAAIAIVIAGGLVFQGVRIVTATFAKPAAAVRR
ncbi:MAG: hypothetical protein HY765_07185 [Rhodomicrobium sp.]|nr:hypothetical protein [Rhodomicrobium sp.]